MDKELLSRLLDNDKTLREDKARIDEGTLPVKQFSLKFKISKLLKASKSSFRKKTQQFNAFILSFKVMVASPQ